jgi:methyl-accepting chemotaxis protein
MHKGELVYEFVMPIVIKGQFMGIVGLQRTLLASLDLMNQMCAGNKINVMLLTNQDVFIAAMCGDVTANDQARATYSALTGKSLDTTEWSNPLRDIVFQKSAEVVSSAVNPLSKANGIHVMGTVRTGGWKVIIEIPGALMFSEMWSDLWVSLVLSIVGIVIMALLILRTATKVVGEVSEVTVGISNTANMMAGSSRQQESMTQNFGSSSVEIAAAVRQITVTGQELLRNMKKIAQASSESAQNASEGRVGVQAIGSTMENLSSATTNVAERLSMIFEKASSINTIIDTITKVSDQTNLLSVNAAIEAEKAGESGRGFLVVAREIRRLADQTASATLDIEKMVQQMQAAVSGGVMEMDRFSEQVRRGVTTVGDVGLRLTKVIDQVSRVESSFSEVTEGMQQQAQGADQIRQAMDGLSQSASRAQDATSEFSSASESLREAIFSLRKVISGEIPV